MSSCKPGLPQTALRDLQRDFPGRDMFSGMKSHHSLSFPSWLWQEGRKQVIKPHYFQNRAKGKDDSMETGPIGVSTPTGVMNLSGPDWLFRVNLEVIKDPTASWPWAGVDLDIGVFLVSSKNREKQQELLSLPLGDPVGTASANDRAASGRRFLAGPALTQHISLGSSDLGNTVRVAFSHGWIAPEQFLWCIRHKHAFCQHQACLISPPAFSPSSYIRYLLRGKSHFFVVVVV